MIPASMDASNPSSGERDVFHRLESDPPAAGWIVIHSLDLPRHVRQISGEIDFVVLVPNRGILCLEIKAAATITRRDGLWFYGRDPNGDPRGPFRRASEGMHSLRVRLCKRYPKAMRAVFWTAVVLPYTSIDFESEEWHPWQLIDSVRYQSTSVAATCLDVLEHARQFLAGTEWAHRFDPESSLPSVPDCEEILHVLHPDFEVFQSPCEHRKLQDAELKRYREEQFTALDATTLNPRVLFEGPAGTGKTLLAIESARRAAGAGQARCSSASTGSSGLGSVTRWRSLEIRSQWERCTLTC